MVYIRRDIEDDIEKWLDDREILVIRGPRQSGKTTLLMKLEEVLKNKGIEEKNIHIVNFEDDIVRLQFEENPKEFVEFLSSGGKNYFLMDEVQYIKNVGKTFKLLFDSFRDIKFILTGSSSFDLTNLGSFLVGRVLFFDLYPLSFLEFLRCKNEKHERLYKKIKVNLSDGNIKAEKTIFINDLNKSLHEYLTFGSYPRVVLEGDNDKKKYLLKNLFRTYIEKDIVSMYGLKQREKVVKLLKAISFMSGSVVTYETLAENAGLKYHEVRSVLPLLEDSFILFVVRPYHKNLLSELRKNPKIYFVDFGLMNYLAGSFENLSFEKLYENFIHNELKRTYTVKYWRTTAKTEVDFIVETKEGLIPIEVKTTPKITRSYRSFIRHYKPSRGIITNLKSLDMKKIDNCDVLILPFVYL